MSPGTHLGYCARCILLFMAVSETLSEMTPVAILNAICIRGSARLTVSHALVGPLSWKSPYRRVTDEVLQWSILHLEQSVQRGRICYSAEVSTSSQLILLFIAVSETLSEVPLSPVAVLNAIMCNRLFHLLICQANCISCATATSFMEESSAISC